MDDGYRNYDEENFDNRIDDMNDLDDIEEVPLRKKGGGKKKPAKKRKKKKRFFTAVYTVLLVCVIILCSWVGYVGSYIYPLIWGDLGDESTEPVTEEQYASFEQGQFTVLMMGCDARPGDKASRSDTLMVAYVDLDQNKVRLVSIPRDTYITIPTTGERTKMNHAYAYGGIELTEETLKSNFDIDIDYKAEVDFQGFIDVIDALGGVTIDVPMDMQYAAEGIDLQAGTQTLNGDQSLQFCRFRSDGQGDLGRVERQQLFMSTLKDQLLSMGTVIKIPDICKAIKDNVVTNLTGAQLLQIMMDLSDGFELITLEPPGEGRYLDDISYFFIYEEQGDAFFEAVNNFQPTQEELDEAAAAAEDSVEGQDNSTEETDAQ